MRVCALVLCARSASSVCDRTRCCVSVQPDYSGASAVRGPAARNSSSALGARKPLRRRRQQQRGRVIEESARVKIKIIPNSSFSLLVFVGRLALNRCASWFWCAN